MNVLKSKKIGLMLSYAYYLLNAIIGIFMSSYTIRIIGKTDYGVYQTITAFLSYLIILEFGIGTITARNISLCKKDGTDDDVIQKNVSTIWSLTLILGTIILIFSFIFWNFIDVIYANSLTPSQIILGKKLFIYASISLLFSFFSQTLNGLILGYEFYSYQYIIQILQLIIRTILVSFMLYFNNSVELIVIVDMLLSIVAFVCSMVFCINKIKIKYIIKDFDKTIFIQITPLALAMFLELITNTANGNVDKFLIGVMMSPEDVAVYSISMTVYLIFASVGSIPVNIYMPQIANTMRDGSDMDTITKSLLKPCRMNVIITGLLLFGFLCVGQSFIHIVYGSEFLESWLYAIVIIIPVYFYMFNVVIINVMDIMRKRYICSIIQIIVTIINIIFTIILMNIIGILGAALATGASYIIQIVLLNYYYCHNIGLNINYLIKESFKGTLLYLAIATIISLLIQLLFNSIYLKFFVGGISFLIVFILLYYFLCTSSSEKEQILHLLIIKRKQ